MHRRGRDRAEAERVMLNFNEDSIFQIRDLPQPQAHNDYSGFYTFRTYLNPDIRRGLTRANFHDLDGDLRLMIAVMINAVRTIEALRDDDYMQIVFKDQLHSVSTPYVPIAQLTPERILALIVAAFTSDQEMFFVNTRITLRYGKLRRGGAGYSRGAIGYNNFVKRGCCVEIKSVNNDCFFQCLALALNPDEDALMKNGNRHANRAAIAARLRAPEHPEGTPVRICEIGLYEALYSINIGIIEYPQLQVVRTGRGRYPTTTWFLYGETEEGAHYTYVNPDRVGALWCQNSWCVECEAAYQFPNHSCIPKCRACRQPNCSGSGQPTELRTIPCNNCGNSFFDADCFRSHIVKKICNRTHRCPDCGDEYRFQKFAQHVCYMTKCKGCKAYVTSEHECYHQPLTAKQLRKRSPPSLNYVFYDYECTIDPDTGIHAVAGIVAMTMSSELAYPFQTTTEFMVWLTTHHRDSTVIAHNGSRYDLHFIKRWCLENGVKSKDVVKSNAIMESYLPDFKLRFIDSIYFIQGSLRNFPKTFGIKHVEKGYFPYTFFTPANINYRGPMPEAKYFEFESFKDIHDDGKPSDRDKAELWYAQHCLDEIDLYEMCMSYCEDDVRLLREGCIRFRNMFMKLTNDEVDPFQRMTIASVCITIYRRFYMAPNTIGVFKPFRGIVEREQWVQSLNLENASRNVYVDEVFVDAKIERSLYIFTPCLEVGCPKCTKPFSYHPDNGRFMHSLNREWQRKLEDLRSAYTVYIMEQCTWDKKQWDMGNCEPALLNMRDAFYGGRTECVKLYYKCTPEEKIRYFDVASLYPSVQSGRLRPFTDGDDEIETEYPIGHPIRLINPEEADIHKYFGFVKCTITSPHDIYIPVLPYRTEDKLMFPNGTFTGTWGTLEVRKAIERGCVVNKVFDLLFFEETTKTMFKDYVDVFLKIKQEAVGRLGLGCITDEELYDYIENYEREQGIELDFDAIGMDKNAGLYFIAKLCLNSLWGKFGQREIFSQTVDTFNREDFDKCAHDDQNEVLNVIMHNTTARTITYRKRKHFNGLSRNTNIAIAAFTTIHARLRLYQALEILGDRIIYMDTDSVVFVERPGDENLLKLGPYLGDFTDELKGNDHIVEFVTTGPKSYAYTTAKGNTVCKIKGFTLNSGSSEILNFASLKDMVLNDRAKTLTTYPLGFIISPYHEIHTKANNSKDFTFTYDKRVPQTPTENCIDTLPKIIKPPPLG